MLTDDVIEDFFFAIDSVDINQIKTLLNLHPSIVLSSPYDEYPFQTASSALNTSEEMYRTTPTPARKELIEEKRLIKKIIFDATVLYALDHEDTDLMQYMYDHQAAPYMTLSDGTVPIEYAIKHGKTKAREWIHNQFQKGREAFEARGSNPAERLNASFNSIFQLTEQKEDLEEAKKAELIANSSSAVEQITKEAKAPIPAPSLFTQPNNGTLFSSSRTIEEQQALLQFQRSSALIDTASDAINSLLAAAKK